MIMAVSLESLVHFLETSFPLSLAESWDNVGLLVGDRSMSVRRVMTCLTVTPESCREAIENQADLIVTHHPFPFQPMRQITTDSTGGTMLWQLIRSGIAVYSAHTAFDSAAGGINQQIAEMLDLKDITALYPPDIPVGGDKCQEPALPQRCQPLSEGKGRIGVLPHPSSLHELVVQVAKLFHWDILPFVGDPNKTVHRVAIGCGAAGDFLDQVFARKADVFLVGEAKFHQFLEATATDISLILPGHFASERFAVEQLAKTITDHFLGIHETVTVWPSRSESDPVRYYRK